MDNTAGRVLKHLLDGGFLDVDSGIAFIGPEAEKHYGRRHFPELLAVFASPPQFRVIAGRREVGSIGVEVLLDDTVGTRLILLGGRSWKVTHMLTADTYGHVLPSRARSAADAIDRVLGGDK